MHKPPDGKRDAGVVGRITNSPTLEYEISSVKAGLLLGTIYLPNGIFKVHANNSIGEESAYTVIVAKKVDIGAEAELVINSNYSATTVPVPEGLGPSSNLRLIK